LVRIEESKRCARPPFFRLVCFLPAPPCFRSSAKLTLLPQACVGPGWYGILWHAIRSGGSLLCEVIAASTVSCSPCAFGRCGPKPLLHAGESLEIESLICALFASLPSSLSSFPRSFTLALQPYIILSGISRSFYSPFSCSSLIARSTPSIRPAFFSTRRAYAPAPKLSIRPRRFRGPSRLPTYQLPTFPLSI
jgi:hypothetical protein